MNLKKLIREAEDSAVEHIMSVLTSSEQWQQRSQAESYVSNNVKDFIDYVQLAADDVDTEFYDAERAEEWGFE